MNMIESDMTCKPCTYSQELEEDYLPTSFSDTRQLSLLSWNHTPAKSCENEQQKDGFQSCACGKGTLDCLIHPSTPDKWIASMQDSLAKTLALLESRQAYLRGPDQVFTVKSCVSLAWLDQNSCSWRTYQQSFLMDSEPYSQTWPRWGMTQGGSAYAHPMSARRITETDGFYWPTPTAHNAKETNAPSESNRNTPTLAAQVGGKLNPDFVGWMMGFPIAWANSKATETHKSPSKLQQLIDSLEGCKE